MNKLGQLVVLVTIAHIITVDATACESLSPHGLCYDGQCDETGCYCKIDAASNITGCNQHCSINATDCPAIKCSGTVDKDSSCGQYCRDNKGRCKMNCWDVPHCIQECSSDFSGGCDYIKCSGGTCTQSCANCTMECTEEVKECNQLCRGGTCKYKCAATECKLDCSQGKCEKVSVDENIKDRNANNTASHMQPGGYFARPILPTFCLIMTIFW